MTNDKSTGRAASVMPYATEPDLMVGHNEHHIRSRFEAGTGEVSTASTMLRSSSRSSAAAAADNDQYEDGIWP